MLGDFPSLSECIVKSDNPYLASIDGVLYSKDLTKLVYYPNCRTGNEYTLLESCISFEISSLISPKY